MDNYRGTAALSESEVNALVSLYNSVNSPNLVLSIESTENFIKHPNNYINDATNSALESQTFYWFYNAIIRDAPDFGLNAKGGNNVAINLRTNNGDNDDYFRYEHNTMAFTWSLGPSSIAGVALSEVNMSTVSTLITDNINYGLYVIQKAGEQVYATVTQFDICVPNIQECDGYVPDDGKWRYFIKIEIVNSGLRDILTESEIKLSMSNDRMSFKSDHYDTSNSRRMLNSVESSVIKSSFFSQEAENIKFQAIIEHSSSGDPLKSADSLGTFDIEVKMYNLTYTATSISFNSYSFYNSRLEKYYKDPIKLETFQIFVAFCLWIFFHSIFLGLQIKFNIINRILCKKPSREEEPKELPNMVTDEVIKSNEIDEKPSLERELKESLSISKSHAELIPKLNNEIPSIRSSKDKEFTKDDSGEICESQVRGKPLF